MTAQEERETEESAQDARPTANIGKSFYSWPTLGTFSGASFLVTALWQTLKNLQIPGYDFTYQVWPLLFSAIVMTGFAFATEPAKRTAPHQKVQKAFITVANTLLVYFAVIGGTTVVVGK